LSGCGLIPKHVEYGQRKVKPVPEYTASAAEHERQAAQYVATKTEQVKVAAIAEHSSTNVLIPAAEANGAAEALTEFIGPPSSPWKDTSTNLVQTLHHDQAKLNLKVEAYREHVEQDVGKKIEGTGWLQLSYFTNAGIIFGVFALIFVGLKIYGMTNPAVGLGVNVAGRVASSVVSRGLSEVVAGGERFKSYLEASNIPSDVKSYVADLFQRAHMEAQSQDVQTVVTTLTAKVPGTTASAPVPAPVTAPPSIQP
jgi:hypothetical protein